MAANVVKNLPGSTSTASGQQTAAANVSTQEFYVRVPKTKKRYHALKFYIPEFDLAQWNKAEMVRDASNQYVPKQDWESQPKTGMGSEYNKEAKELARRKKFGYMPKKISPDDMPWIVTSKGSEKEKTKDKHYIGKKMITENSSFYIFTKCADGGFEAYPLEDWYTFTAHKAYKTLNIEEAEEEYKRRHKIMNKYLIMANKRKNEGEDDEEGETGITQKGGTKSFSFSSTVKSAKQGVKSDDEDSDGEKTKKKNYKSSNLSDDEEEEETVTSKPTKGKGKGKKKAKPAKNSDDEEEVKTKEDSDDGDAEGLEKDYSSTGESDMESEHEKEEQYEEKGIDEEEPIKALDKSDDESESEEDEGLTEEGKEYRKLMSKDGEKKEEENEEFNEFFRTGKTTFKKDPDDDSKDSNSTSGISEFDEDGELKKGGSKLKRKATDDLGPKGLKKANKNSASAPNMTGSNAMTHDESSSSSSTSATPAIKAQQAGALPTSKSSKTAAVIAAAEAAKQSANSSQSSNKPVASPGFSSTSQLSSSSSSSSSNSIISEEEVRRYLSRKPMTTKELLQKFRGKTQNTLTKEQLLESLRIILDRLHPKMIEKNGVKYLSLS